MYLPVFTCTDSALFVLLTGNKYNPNGGEKRIANSACFHCRGETIYRRFTG